MADSPEVKREKSRLNAARYRANNPGAAKAYRELPENKERASLVKAKYILKNKEKIKNARKDYYENNKDILNAKTKKWRESNVNHIKEYEARYRGAHKERRKITSSNHQKTNKEKYRIYNKNRYSLRKRHNGRLSHGLAEKLYKLQKGKCPCCRLPLGKDYHMDHVMPLSLGGSNTDDNIQLLRKTCNLQKNAKHPFDFMQSRGFLF